jgi:hypothetical protein
MMAHNSTCFLEVTSYPKGWNWWVCVAIQHEKDWVLARNIFGLAISCYVQLIARGSLNPSQLSTVARTARNAARAGFS